MPSFSNRRGAPSSRQENESCARCRGRRPGNAATCRARLKGWLLNVAARSPIWGDVDLKAFCATTGYSREHATRELSRLRRGGELAFETKLRRKRGAKVATWGVIVADPAKLRFDQRSLFYGRDGEPLHNYTTLAAGGEKIPPTIILPAPHPTARGRPRTRTVAPERLMKARGRPPKKTARPEPITVPPATAPASAPTPVQASQPEQVAEKSDENPRLCDNPLEEDYFVIQQQDLHGARRDVARSRGEEGAARPALKRKAFSLQARLEACHWDNCKVTFSSRTAHNYALRALVDGHAEERIVSCYADALFVCHGFAVDRSASAGKVVFFNPSSTVVKAASLLAKDGLTRADRMALWYANHPRRNVEPPPPLPADIEAIRAQIAATFPRDKPPRSTERQ